MACGPTSLARRSYERVLRMPWVLRFRFIAGESSIFFSFPNIRNFEPWAAILLSIFSRTGITKVRQQPQLSCRHGFPLFDRRRCECNRFKFQQISPSGFVSIFRTSAQPGTYCRALRMESRFMVNVRGLIAQGLNICTIVYPLPPRRGSQHVYMVITTRVRVLDTYSVRPHKPYLGWSNWENTA